MTVQGRVVDARTGNPLQDASISIIGKDGKALGYGTQAGLTGVFSLDSPLLDTNYVLVSFVGYQSVIYDPKDLVSVISSIIPLQLQKDVLPNVDVTANLLAGNTGMFLLLALVFGLIYFSSKRKRKRMAGVDASNYVIPIGVVIGGYFLINGLLGKLGFGKDKIDTSKEEADQIAADKQKAAGDTSAANNMSNRNMSDASLNSIATQLTDGTSSFSYDYKTVLSMLAYFSRFRSADAVKFLGIFVKVNGVTLYQWYRSKFLNATLFDWSAIGQYAPEHAENFKAMGVDMDNIGAFGMTQAEFVNICVSYLYKVSGLSMT